MKSKISLNQIDTSTTNLVLKAMNDTGQTNFMIANFLNRTIEHISNDESDLKYDLLQYDEPNFSSPNDKLKIAWFLISNFFKKRKLNKTYNTALKEMPYIKSIKLDSSKNYKSRFHCPNGQSLFNFLLRSPIISTISESDRPNIIKIDITKTSPKKKKKRSSSAKSTPKRSINQSIELKEREIKSVKKTRRSKSLSRTPKKSTSLKDQSANVTPRLSNINIYQSNKSNSCPRHYSPINSPRKSILNSIVMEKVKRPYPPNSESKIKNSKRRQSLILTRNFENFDSCSYNDIEIDDYNNLVSKQTQTSEKDMYFKKQKPFKVKKRKLIKLESLESLGNIGSSDFHKNSLLQIIENKISQLNIKNPLFIIRVKIIEAKNLPVLDLFGQLDPFCQVQVNSTIYKTKIIEDNKAPVWNQVFEFKAKSIDDLSINISIYDSDPLGTDELLGYHAINIIEEMNDWSLDKVFILNSNNELKMKPEIHLMLNLDVVDQSKC